MDKKTVYDMILNHGREDVFLYYATVVGDFEKVLEHHIMDEAWLKAVDVLNRQVRGPRLSHVFKHCPNFYNMTISQLSTSITGSPRS